MVTPLFAACAVLAVDQVDRVQLDGLIDTYRHQQVRLLASLNEHELTEQEIVQQRTLTQQGE